MIIDFVKRYATWWNGATFGTRLFTAKHGRLVGEDESGNKYYVNETGDRRWVIYAGETEASTVSPDWHGWLHHTFDEIPSETPLPRQAWEKPHKPNLTGTPGAYHPPGSLAAAQPRPARARYEAWTPE